MTPPLHAFRAQGFGGLYAVATDVYLFLRVEDIAFAWCQLLPRVEFTERGYPFVSIQTWEGLLEKIRQCVAPAEGDDDDALVSARTSNVPGRRAQPRAGDLYTLGDELEDEREACEADGGDEADADAGDEEEMSDSSEAAQLEAAAPTCSAAPSGLTEEQYVEAVEASMGLEDRPQGTEQPPIDGEEQPDGDLLFSNGGCAPPLPAD